MRKLWHRDKELLVQGCKVVYIGFKPEQPGSPIYTYRMSLSEASLVRFWQTRECVCCLWEWGSNVVRSYALNRRWISESIYIKTLHVDKITLWILVRSVYILLIFYLESENRIFQFPWQLEFWLWIRFCQLDAAERGKRWKKDGNHFLVTAKAAVVSAYSGGSSLIISFVRGGCGSFLIFELQLQGCAIEPSPVAATDTCSPALSMTFQASHILC